MPPAELDSSATLPDWLSFFLQFKSYAAFLLASALATAALTPAYLVIARRLGWVDRPCGRKQHGQATATMGGIVIFLVVFCGAAVSLSLDNLVGQRMRAEAVYVYGLLGCAGCMLLLGVVDDRHGVRPKVKLLVQSIVAMAAVLLGFRVEAVTLPGFESLVLPGVVGGLLSLIWILGITNAINLTDGLDGLAAGICLLASAVNAVVAIWLGNHYMTVMMVLLAGALIGFLRWNFHPARVFLGDTGSLALGMFLALASLKSAQKAHTVLLILVPLFALGYPIFDTLLAVARRMVRGQPLFASDRDHIHHRLLDRGSSPSGAAVRIYAASILVSLLCAVAATANHLALGLALLGVLAMALFSARVLGYLEWGGWQRRWTGRSETKALHAAAQLARIKIEQSHTTEAAARALGVMATEIGCREIVIEISGRAERWSDGMVTSPTAGDGGRFEFAPDQNFRIQYALEAGASLDAERRQLIEELSRLVDDQLRGTGPEAPPGGE